MTAFYLRLPDLAALGSGIEHRCLLPALQPLVSFPEDRRLVRVYSSPLRMRWASSRYTGLWVDTVTGTQPLATRGLVYSRDVTYKSEQLTIDMWPDPRPHEGRFISYSQRIHRCSGAVVEWLKEKDRTSAHDTCLLLNNKVRNDFPGEVTVQLRLRDLVSSDKAERRGRGCAEGME